jgi:hypothetical protein
MGELPGGAVGGWRGGAPDGTRGGRPVMCGRQGRRRQRKV